MSKRILLVLSILILISVSTYAQGDYLELGKSGSQLGIQLAGNEDAFSFSFSGGLSYYGIIDGQFSMGLGHLSKYSGIAYIFSPAVVIYPIKQGLVNIPFSVAVGASYQFVNLTGKNVRISESSSVLGAWLFRNISTSESFTFQPNIGVSRTQLEERWENQVNYFDLGMSLFIKIAKKNKTVRFDLAFSSSENIKNFGVQLGLIFEAHKDKVDERWDW